MTRFCVGDQVIIRWGKQQGQKTKIIQTRPANVYVAKVEDGSVSFFTEKGLQRENEGVKQGVR